jgi:hypothetical protein
MHTAVAREWQRLHAEHAAAHQEYFRVKLLREEGVPDVDPAPEDLYAHIAAKSNLAKAQRAVHEFCQKHIE